MPDVIDFEETMKRTEEEDRALLIGNGFSAKYFSYNNLLEESDLAAGTPVRNLFDSLRTVDFEAVVRVLEGATTVERAYASPSSRRTTRCFSAGASSRIIPGTLSSAKLVPSIGWEKLLAARAGIEFRFGGPTYQARM